MSIALRLPEVENAPIRLTKLRFISRPVTSRSGRLLLGRLAVPSVPRRTSPEEPRRLPAPIEAIEPRRRCANASRVPYFRNPRLTARRSLTTVVQQPPMAPAPGNLPPCPAGHWAASTQKRLPPRRPGPDRQLARDPALGQSAKPTAGRKAPFGSVDTCIFGAWPRVVDLRGIRRAGNPQSRPRAAWPPLGQ